MNFIRVESSTCSSAGSGLLLAGGYRLTLDARINPGGTQVHELGVRPEDFQLSSDTHTLAVVVEVIEQLGSDTIVYGHLVDGQRITVRLQGQAHLQAGQRIGVVPVSERVIVFDAQGLNLAMHGAPTHA